MVIMAGAGEQFSGPPRNALLRASKDRRQWNDTYWEGKRLIMNLPGHRGSGD